MKPALWYRIRGLKKMERRLGGAGLIQAFINKRLEKGLKPRSRVRVLEIGYGEGKCLLEIRKKFPSPTVELYGVNSIKEWRMRSQNDFIKNAKWFKLPVPPRDLLPKPYFFDAGERFGFPSNFFDCIISQVAVPYIGDKARCVEEVWRVLKPEGRAFLHLDTYETTYPDFLQMNKETPRFLVYKGNRRVNLSAFLKPFQRKGFDIRLKSPQNWKSNRALLIVKSQAKPLRLHLTLDRKSTFSLTKIRETHRKKNYKKNPWWGTRSVFYVK